MLSKSIFANKIIGVRALPHQRDEILIGSLNFLVWTLSLYGWPYLRVFESRLSFSNLHQFIFGMDNPYVSA
jgi:hypothetical protein